MLSWFILILANTSRMKPRTRLRLASITMEPAVNPAHLCGESLPVEM